MELSTSAGIVGATYQPLGRWAGRPPPAATRAPAWVATVHPAASDGAVFQEASVTGAFHGMIAAITPTGSFVTRPARSPATTWRSKL